MDTHQPAHYVNKQKMFSPYHNVQILSAIQSPTYCNLNWDQTVQSFHSSFFKQHSCKKSTRPEFKRSGFAIVFLFFSGQRSCIKSTRPWSKSQDVRDQFILLYLHYPPSPIYELGWFHEEHFLFDPQYLSLQAYACHSVVQTKSCLNLLVINVYFYHKV